MEKSETMMFSNRSLKRLIWPLVVEQLLAVTIGMADTVMVASCGEAAVSGVSLVDSINILLINVFSALATGGAIVASQYLGRDDLENANLAARQLLLSVGFLSALLAALALVGNVSILNLIFGSAEADVMQNSYTYFFWSALSYPFLGIYNGGAALFRAMGNSKVSMRTSIIMNILNICGNALLIFVFQLGVAGAAISTLVSRALGAVVMVWLLHSKPHQSDKIHLTSFNIFRPDWSMIKKILNIGVPNGLENGMFQIGKILVQGLIATFGTAAIAANAAANSIASLPQIPSTAVGLAMVTVIGQCVGAGEYEQAKRYTRRLTMLSYLCITVLSLAEMAAAYPLAGLFNLSAEATQMAVQVILWNGVFTIVIWPASFTLPNGLRAAGDVRFTMGISVLSMWIFRIGFSYLLAQGLQLGLMGVWFAMFIDWFVRAVLFIWRFLSNRWRGKAIR